MLVVLKYSNFVTNKVASAPINENRLWNISVIFDPSSLVYWLSDFSCENSAPASLMWFMENWKMKTELIDRKKSTSNQNHLDSNQSQF